VLVCCGIGRSSVEWVLFVAGWWYMLVGLLAFRGCAEVGLG
jgi:hypothetical protein